MKVLVAVKRVVDIYVKIHVNSDQTGIETANVKISMNPFNEIKRKRHCQRNYCYIYRLSTDSGDAENSPCSAGRAIQVVTDVAVESLAVAKILKSIVDKESPDIVILGKQAIDTDNNQTGQMLAALLDWPQGTFASELVFEDGALSVVREIYGGLKTLAMSTLTSACLISTRPTAEVWAAKQLAE